MLVPSSNTVLEPELARLVHDLSGTTIFVTRVQVTRIGIDQRACDQFDPNSMAAAARLVGDAKVDVVVWAGTSGSWMGRKQDEVIVQLLGDVTGVYATTSTLSMTLACSAFRVKQVALFTPYTHDIVELISQNLEKAGISVVAVENLDISDNYSFAEVDPALLKTLLKRASTVEGVQAVLVMCTNLRTTPFLAELENELGVLILDSVLATLWGAHEAAQRPIAFRGEGMLLSQGSIRLQILQVIRDLILRKQLLSVGVYVQLPGGDPMVDVIVLEEFLDESTGKAVLSKRVTSCREWLSVTSETFGVSIDALLDSSLTEPIHHLGEVLFPILENGTTLGWWVLRSEGHLMNGADDILFYTRASKKVVEAVNLLQPARALSNLLKD